MALKDLKSSFGDVSRVRGTDERSIGLCLQLFTTVVNQDALQTGCSLWRLQHMFSQKTLAANQDLSLAEHYFNNIEAGVAE